MHILPFPFDLLSNFANFLVVLLFLLIFYKKKLIDLKILIILIISSISPFFVNDFLFPWEYMYDQIRYSITTHHLRNFDFSLAEFEYGKIGSTVRFASYLYFFVPIPFIFHISAIAFMNKLIYVCLFTYLYSKKYLNNLTSLFYLFYPSLILYTSVSLRDILVCSTTIMSSIMFLRKKYISSILFGVLALLIKPSLFIFIALILIFYFLLIETLLNQKKSLPLLISSIISLLVFLIFGDSMFNYANFYREAFYWDAGISKSEMPFIKDKYHMIFHIFKNSLTGFTKPGLFEVTNIFQLFQAVENMILIGFLIIIFKNLYIKSKSKFYYWLFSLLLLIGIFNTIVPNEGTYVRYKFSIIMTFVTIITFEITALRNSKYEKK